jgi:alpha-tubulin suppressor-like RCC1 family protein
VNGFNDEKVVMISCGRWHSMVLIESGRAFSWGHNSSGQLDFGNTENSNKPILIELNDVSIKNISCCHSHSLLFDGIIYAFGDNSCEKIGNWNKEYQSKPVKQIHENRILDIASLSCENIPVSLPVEKIYYVWGNCGTKLNLKPFKINFKSFNKISLNYCNKTFVINDDIIQLDNLASISGKQP